MSSPVTARRYTQQEYLALERRADWKSEYVNGQIMAMAGASRQHNLIAGNFYREVSQQLRGRPCDAHISDIRVGVSCTGLYTYPDVVVVCGTLHCADAQNDTLLNPTVIVAVLSASTEAYERGKKFAHYRRLKSLQDYLLVAQHKVRIEHYVRQGSTWVLSELSALNDTVPVVSIDCAIAVREVYDKIQFDRTTETL
ncbi:MAG: Uma2 family endonuclease [Candidatus Tectimicrobiota bacterium]